MSFERGRERWVEYYCVKRVAYQYQKGEYWRAQDGAVL